MVTLPFSQSFGCSGIMFRWATTSIDIAPSLALSGASQSVGSNHHPSLGSRYPNHPAGLSVFPTLVWARQLNLALHAPCQVLLQYRPHIEPPD